MPSGVAHVAYREIVAGVTVMVEKLGNNPAQGSITLHYACDGVDFLTAPQMDQLANVLRSAADALRAI